jgi:hypothetical protein
MFPFMKQILTKGWICYGNANSYSLFRPAKQVSDHEIPDSHFLFMLCFFRRTCNLTRERPDISQAFLMLPPVVAISSWRYCRSSLVTADSRRSFRVPIVPRGKGLAFERKYALQNCWMLCYRKAAGFYTNKK